MRCYTDARPVSLTANRSERKVPQLEQADFLSSNSYAAEVLSVGRPPKSKCNTNFPYPVCYCMELYLCTLHGLVHCCTALCTPITWSCAQLHSLEDCCLGLCTGTWPCTLLHSIVHCCIILCAVAWLGKNWMAMFRAGMAVFNVA